MILSNKEIEKLMDNPRNGKSIVAGESLQKEHKLHITGEGYEGEIKQVEGYESEGDFNIRKQIAQPATIQLTTTILDNLNRWITAQGTVKKVDFQDQTKSGEFEKVLEQVWYGDSFDKFITTFYKEAIYIEFNGFALATKPKIIEEETDDKSGVILKDGVLTEKPKGSLDPYLIFIANSDVYDYWLTGDKVEYIIIKLEKENFRLIDDEKDILFTWHKKGKDNIIPTEGEMFLENEIGYVPARKISSINKRIMSSQVKTSPIDHVVPALDRYFSSDADLRIQFIRHNYPKLAIVTKECVPCNGTGKTNKLLGDGTYDNDTIVKCSGCDGSGRAIPISRDGVIGLPQYLDPGDTAYPGSPASYITPETESLKLGLEDLEKQKQDIIYSGTGDKNLIAESLNTATENLINFRSLEDRIKEITQMVEDFEVFMKTAIKDLHKDFSGIETYFITVRYGKRISIRNESELLTEMQESKKAGMPFSYIEALNKDLIFAKYKNDAQELERQLLLADVEPLAAYTIDEIDKLQERIFPRDLEVKINFDSLVMELGQEEPINLIAKGKPYPDRIKEINEKIDKILLTKKEPNEVLQK